MKPTEFPLLEMFPGEGTVQACSIYFPPPIPGGTWKSRERMSFLRPDTPSSSERKGVFASTALSFWRSVGSSPAPLCHAPSFTLPPLMSWEAHIPLKVHGPEARVWKASQRPLLKQTPPLITFLHNQMLAFSLNVNAMVQVGWLVFRAFCFLKSQT